MVRIPLARTGRAAAFAVAALGLLMSQHDAAVASHREPGRIYDFAAGGVVDGVAPEQSVVSPVDIAVSAAGDLYISDVEHCRIRKVSGGVISTIAGNEHCLNTGDGGPAVDAGLRPGAMAFDAAGNLYVSTECLIRKITPGGTISTFAGRSDAVCGNADSGDGGPATSAVIRFPYGLVFDAAGNLYVSSWACVVRKIDTSGMISTVVGEAMVTGCGYSGDGGLATAAAINNPMGLAIDAMGDLYIAEVSNCVVRKVSGGTISTVAGTGVCASSGDGGAATAGELLYPHDVVFDAAGDLYITEGNECRLRKVSGGIISTVAGAGGCGYGGDGGPAAAALFNWPESLAASGNTLYITDRGNCRVRVIDAGIIDTFAGSGSCTYGGDDGPALNAASGAISAIAVTAAEDVYIADATNCVVRKVSGGIITRVAGNGVCGDSGDGGPATFASLGTLRGLAVDDATGDFYISQYPCRIRKVSGGIIEHLAGDGSCTDSGVDGPAATTSINPGAIAIGPGGDLYMVSYPCRIRRIFGGMLTTVAGTGTCGWTPDGPALAAHIEPWDLDVDGAGHLLFTDGPCTVRMLDGGTITTVGGVPPGDPACATLVYPSSVTLDGDGNIYVFDSVDCRIRRITPSVVMSVAGHAGCDFDLNRAAEVDGGSATLAALGPWADLAIVGTHLYLAETDPSGYFAIGRVRVIELSPGDVDSDGCDDAVEAGISPALGGQRNPLQFWDFFDVTGDRSVDLSDTLDVLSYFGSNAADGTHANLRDRDNFGAAQPWQTYEANDGVDLTDALVNLQSFGHDCSGPP